MFQAIYRQMRPTCFAEIVGQEAVTQTLQNQIRSGRVHHAYLFCGTRGTGKTSTAKVLARAVTCLDPKEGEACGVCAACEDARKDNPVDIFEMDAASNNGVDDIRALRDGVNYPPQVGRYKVYIIDEVHMLSTGAFNALLKTLEEPPAHVVFILATTEPQKLPATILSRCQRFDFHRISTKEIESQLEKACDHVGKEYDPQALFSIAQAGEGSMRDALSLLDLCVATAGEQLSQEVVSLCLGTSGRQFLFAFADACAAGDAGRCLAMVDELLSKGREPGVFAKELGEHMRQIMITHLCGPEAEKILEVSEQDAKRLMEQAKAMAYERVLRAMEVLARAQADMRQSTQPRSILELAVVRICHPQTQRDDLLALEERVRKLETMIREGTVVSSAPKAERPASKRASSPAAPQNPAPAPKAVTQDGAALWKAVLAKVRQEKIKLFFSLKLASLASFDGKNAVVVFPKEQQIHLQSCEKEENRIYLEQVFSGAAGGPVFLSLTCGQDAGGTPASPDGQEKVEDALKKAFGAENVQILNGR